MSYLNTPNQELSATLDSGVLTLAINRPKSKNALYDALYLAVVDALKQADADPQVRCVILRGQGADFTAGNDMGDFIKSFDYDLDAIKSGDLPPFALMKAVTCLTKPILLAIKGVAIGIGVTLLLHADMAFADDSAVFQMPFISLGLTTEGAISQLMADKIGYSQTAELLFTAKKFGRADAESLGLINRWQSDGEDLYDYVDQKAKLIAKLPPNAIVQTKALMKKNLTELLAYIDDEAEIFMRSVQSAECKEAVTAFFEKHSPNFN